jgi:enterochelin esterase family protein
MNRTRGYWRLFAIVVCFFIGSNSLVHAQEQQKPATPPPMPAFKPSPNDLITPPEISADGKVIFKLFAPEAKSVNIRGEWLNFPEALKGTPLQRGDDGVWSTTIPIKPGVYRYSYLVDGLTLADPRNPSSSQSLNFVHSMVAVPGLEFLDIQKVPHGTVETVWYQSTALGTLRRMHVYLPPGYDKDSAKYPVFYLLHGAGDSDDSWSTVGHSGFILDNLIAEKKAKPMIVVMPAGHVNRNFVWGDPGSLAVGEFEKDFLKDILPLVESHYRVQADRDHRAIAGLSMGGMQSLNIAMTDPDKFAYVGVFSSGWIQGIADNAEKQFAAGLNDARAKKGLKLLWFATGKDDFLMPTTQNTIALLKKHGFQPDFHESAGGHTWQNWQAYLHEFAPKLFQ